MVNVKGVKNLVWVFNPEASLDVSWDPGADYYDIISVDIYNNDNDHSSNSAAFDSFKDKWGTSKILALSENGPIPDVNNMHTDQAVWSWWMPWYSSWSGKWPGQTSNSVWKNKMEDDRIITFEDMPGWDSNIELSSNSNVSVSSNSTSPTSSASNSANSNNNSTTPGSNSSNTEAIGVNTLPAGATLTFQGSSLSFTTIRATSVSLDVFDLQGNRVASLYKGTLSAGTHQFSLSGMARGSYIVRAKGAGIAATQKFVIR
jgi:hypothetical protein